MRRILATMLLAIASFALLGCSQSEFKVDGEFTAYALSVTNNKPVLTTVSVTIEKGKIAGYNIDVRQGYRNATTNDQGTVETSDDTTTYAFGWNELTKKELGFNYKMFYYQYVGTLEDVSTARIEGYQEYLTANNLLEWHQQAALLEQYWLENGLDDTIVDENGDFVNVAGVSVSNENYLELAKQAVELARAGEFQAVVCSGTDLYIASMTVANGSVSNLVLDVQQSTKSTTLGTFEWKEHTKQQYRFDYKMHYNAYVATLDDVSTASIEGYEGWLTENNRLEWFEQADLITDYIMQHGWDGTLQSIHGDGVSLDGINVLDGMSGVSIATDSHFEVLNLLYSDVGQGKLE